MVKYIVGVLILAIFVFFGVTLFRTVTKDDTPKETAVTNTVPVKALTEYSNSDAEVSVTTTGPVVGTEARRQIRITVGRTRRSVEVLSGYQDRVIASKSYPNDQAAYDIFLRAINSFGFTAGKKPRVNDEYAACPTGTMYTYELSNTGSKDTDVRLWSVTCGIEIGTFAGGPGPTIRDLFQKQIPDYAEVTKDVGL